LTSALDGNIIVENTNIIKKNTEALLELRREGGLEANTEKLKLY
jgi:hypothetical protein